MPPPPSKKPRPIDESSVMRNPPPPPRRSRRMAGRLNATFDDLSTDELAIIFGFLCPFEILIARLNKKMRDAAKQTIVPMTKFVVDSVRKYNALAAMSTALPNLQQITLCGLGWCRNHKYSDGENQNGTLAAKTANFTSLDLNIIHNFRKLRVLEINRAPMNGRYHVLFRFPLLQKLLIAGCNYLKFDLDMLEGLPQLRELQCHNIPQMSGNLRSLRVVKDSLELVSFEWCMTIQGNFMDMADFPRLKKLDLWGSNVLRGHIRDIGDRDFLALEELILPERICGGKGFEFRRVADAPNLISALYPIRKQRPVLLKGWFGMLSQFSPDWYEGIDDDNTVPIFIEFVQAGSRVGYHWYAMDHMAMEHMPCEVIWLDPEPDRDRESSDYEKYMEELQEIENEVDMFKGFQQPPTEDEYHRRCAECFANVEYVDGEVFVY